MNDPTVRAIATIELREWPLVECVREEVAVSLLLILGHAVPGHDGVSGGVLPREAAVARFAGLVVPTKPLEEHLRFDAKVPASLDLVDDGSAVAGRVESLVPVVLVDRTELPDRFAKPQTVLVLLALRRAVAVESCRLALMRVPRIRPLERPTWLRRTRVIVLGARIAIAVAVAVAVTVAVSITIANRRVTLGHGGVASG